MAPDSLRSESIGLLSCLCSGALESCESTITGQSISLASSFRFLDITDIFIGVSEVDYSGYVDCREEFIRSMEATINLGTVLGAEKKRHITLHAPFMHMTKADEVRLGASLGVDYSLTWTCYRGGDKPCGTCDSCLLRAKAFAEAGIDDPTVKP